MHQHRASGAQEAVPQQVVGEGPVVVLAVDVEVVDRLGPTGPGLRRVLLDVAHHLADRGAVEVGEELLLRRRPAEEPTLDERVDRHDLAATGLRHPAEHDGGAALVAADLEQRRARAQVGGLVVQQPRLVAGEPAGDLVGDRPDLVEGGAGVVVSASP